MTKGHDKGHKSQMSDREVMKLALDALLIWEKMHPKTTASSIRSPAIQALQEALEQEPWDTSDMAHRPNGLSMGQEHESRITSLEVRVAKLENPMTGHEKQLMAGQRSLLRTAPPKREWVGLTDEEREYLWGITPIEDEDRFAFVLAVEAKLKEKNA